MDEGAVVSLAAAAFLVEGTKDGSPWLLFIDRVSFPSVFHTPFLTPAHIQPFFLQLIAFHYSGMDEGAIITIGAPAFCIENTVDIFTHCFALAVSSSVQISFNTLVIVPH
eukprot:12402113-Heterocapsa_arctica.AAC.1